MATIKSIEEKAKRYDEALERAKAVIEQNPLMEYLKKGIEYIFPELKESEGERIRKELIEQVVFIIPNDDEVDSEGNVLPTYQKRIDKYIAWLEKQGESYTKRDVDDAYLKGVTNTKNEIEKQYEANYQIRKDIATFIFNYKGDIKDRAKWMDYLGIKVSFAEKQGEQKPADKQKFHEGDWIVNTVGDTNKVVKVFDDGYTLDDNTFLSKSWATKHYHLWTIQDAKDGDVLEYQGEIFIIRELKKKVIASRTIEYYCCYDGEHFINNSIYSLMDDDLVNIHPSTKEQHNLLLQKMKEAGYEWDAEKLELKKIEEKSAEWRQDNVEELTDFENAMMHIGDSFFGQHQGLDPNDTSVVKEQANLLLELVLDKEWSEEDENRINRLIAYFEDKESFTAEDDIVYANWLKSLRPQNTWKPSDEQMIAIQEAINIVGITITGSRINSLYQDLKKLKGIKL